NQTTTIPPTPPDIAHGKTWVSGQQQLERYTYPDHEQKREQTQPESTPKKKNRKKELEKKQTYILPEKRTPKKEEKPKQTKKKSKTH
ncbi:MAG: hypothetical protein QW594_02340, partial [Candidatus Woesearchaeota archaeon]